MISILDSGMGGICFYEAMPFECHLVIDRKNFPYGNKDLLWLKKHFIKLIQEIKSDTIIVACNTLSSLIYYYKLTFSKKVVDVIAPTIFYLRKLNIKSLLILATKNTIKMDIYGRLLNNEITYYDATEIIDAIEHNDYENKLDSLLSDIGSFDAVLLGCTHLIKIKDELRKNIKCMIISQDEIVRKYFV